MTPTKRALNNLLANPTEENSKAFYALFLEGRNTKAAYISEINQVLGIEEVNTLKESDILKLREKMDVLRDSLFNLSGKKYDEQLKKYNKAKEAYYNTFN